jgi:hypothetical protein
MHIKYKTPLMAVWEHAAGSAHQDDVKAMLDGARTRMAEFDRTIDNATRMLTEARYEHAIADRTVSALSALVQELDLLRSGAPGMQQTPGTERVAQAAPEAPLAAGSMPEAANDEMPSAVGERHVSRWQWSLAAFGALLVLVGVTKWLAPGVWDHAADFTVARLDTR